MTNPGNAIGTNAAYGGRTSVNAFNDLAAGFANGGGGILSGWEPEVNDSGNVVLGGNHGVKDVAIAMDPNGNIVTLNNISGQPIPITMGQAPSSGDRTDYIIGYVNNPPQGNSSTPDNPGACGITVLEYTGTNTPTATEIQQAITQDGGAGATAYYVILAQVLRKQNETVITTLGPGSQNSVKSQINRELNARGPFVLYENADGSAGTINLALSTANFKRIKIFYHNNDGYYTYTEVYNPDGKSVSLMSGYVFTDYNAIILKATNLKISGATLTPSDGGEVTLRINQPITGSISNNNNNLITRVEGYTY